MTDISSRIKNISPLMWVTVVVPTVLAVIYYSFIAADVYVAESKFVVRNPSKPSISTSGLAAMLEGVGSGSSSDGYQVQDYLESRDALHALNADDYIRKAYSEHGDWVSRYHAFGDYSFESLWRYYKRNIQKVKIDDQSSIATLTTRAYSAEDALGINNKLLSLSEALINRMNARAEGDAVSFAAAALAKAQRDAIQANADLAAYRQSDTVFDPNEQSAIQLRQISTLETSLFSAETQLAQLTQVAPDSAQIHFLKTNIDQLRKQIAESNGGLTGGTESLSAKASNYMKLQLKVDFAARQLGVALASMEAARQNAEKKKLYIERIVDPMLPDEAIEPKRIRGVITVFIAGLLAFATLSLLISSVREHRE